MGKHATRSLEADWRGDRHAEFSGASKLYWQWCHCRRRVDHDMLDRSIPRPRHRKHGIMVLHWPEYNGDETEGGVGGFEWDMTNFQRLYELRDKVGSGTISFLTNAHITDILEELF